MPDLTRTHRTRLRVIAARTIAGMPLDPRRIGGLDTVDSKLVERGLLERRGTDMNARLFVTAAGHNALRGTEAPR